MKFVELTGIHSKILINPSHIVAVMPLVYFSSQYAKEMNSTRIYCTDSEEPFEVNEPFETVKTLLEGAEE